MLFHTLFSTRSTTEASGERVSRFKLNRLVGESGIETTKMSFWLYHYYHRQSYSLKLIESSLNGQYLALMEIDHKYIVNAYEVQRVFY